MRTIVVTSGLIGLLIAGTIGTANAGDSSQRVVVPNKYRITADEQTACASDAIQLCSEAYPDEDKLLSCMLLNRVSLSTICRPVFDEGVRRRHLN